VTDGAIDVTSAAVGKVSDMGSRRGCSPNSTGSERMSALGHKRTFALQKVMGFTPKSRTAHAKPRPIAKPTTAVGGKL
jgi:hypothetical protein